jgi:hypothetical protein
VNFSHLPQFPLGWRVNALFRNDMRHLTRLTESVPIPEIFGFSKEKVVSLPIVQNSQFGWYFFGFLGRVWVLTP